MKFIVPEPKKANNNSFSSSGDTLDDKGGSVIAAEYIELRGYKHGQSVPYVATTSSKPLISLWDPVGDTFYSLRGKATPAAIQLCIKWGGPKCQRLFSAGIDMVIHAYSIDNNKIEHVMSSGIRHRADDIGRELSGNQTGGNEEVYHTRWITDLLPIPDMNLIASASIDSNMCLWDMSTLKGKSLHGKPLGHKHPIYSLEW